MIPSEPPCQYPNPRVYALPVTYLPLWSKPVLGFMVTSQHDRIRTSTCNAYHRIVANAHQFTCSKLTTPARPNMTRGNIKVFIDCGALHSSTKARSIHHEGNGIFPTPCERDEHTCVADITLPGPPKRVAGNLITDWSATKSQLWPFS